MDFVTLLALAETKQFSAEMCADSFGRQYSSYKLIIEPNIKIKIPSFRGKIEDDEDDYTNEEPGVIPNVYIIGLFPNKSERDERGDRSIFEVVVGDLGVVLKALRIFGNGVQKIHLSLNNVDRDAAEKITHYAKQYGTRSSLKLEL